MLLLAWPCQGRTSGKGEDIPPWNAASNENHLVDSIFFSSSQLPLLSAFFPILSDSSDFFKLSKERLILLYCLLFLLHWPVQEGAEVCSGIGVQTLQGSASPLGGLH